MQEFESLDEHVKRWEAECRTVNIQPSHNGIVSVTANYDNREIRVNWKRLPISGYEKDISSGIVEIETYFDVQDNLVSYQNIPNEAHPILVSIAPLSNLNTVEDLLKGGKKETTTNIFYAPTKGNPTFDYWFIDDSSVTVVPFEGKAYRSTRSTLTGTENTREGIKRAMQREIESRQYFQLQAEEIAGPIPTEIRRVTIDGVGYEVQYPLSGNHLTLIMNGSKSPFMIRAPIYMTPELWNSMTEHIADPGQIGAPLVEYHVKRQEA